MVSYEGKHNEANGEDNRDGAHDNLSSNYGVEGPSDDPVIVSYRERVKRSMLTSLLCSLGTPMLQMGDECGRTQRGNNNAYAQDNELSWFDWTLLATPPGRDLAAFVSRLSELRRNLATLRSNRFLDGAEIAPGLTELSWWDERGRQLAPGDWDNQEARALILRRALRLRDGRVELTALMMNGGGDGMAFALPGDYPWKRLIDTSDPALETAAAPSPYFVADRCAVLLACEIEI